MGLVGRDSLSTVTTTQRRRSWSKFPAIANVAARIKLCKSSGHLMGPSLPLFRKNIISNSGNSVLQRKKETRKRNLSFHLPAAISCSPTLRLFQTDSSYITLCDIYELHCEDTGISREEPILFAGEKVKKTLREFRQTSSRQVCKIPNPTNFQNSLCDS